MGLTHEHLVLSNETVLRALRPQAYPNTAGRIQRDDEMQFGFVFGLHYLEANSRQSATQPIESVRMGFDARPDRVQGQGQIGPHGQMHWKRSIRSISLRQSIPREPQPEIALAMLPGLEGDERTFVVAALAIRGAYAEHSLPAPQKLDPLVVALKVAIARMPQAPRVRVHDTEYAKLLVLLPQNPAGQGLGFTIEPDMGDSRFAFRTSRQGGQGQRLGASPMPHENPSSFLLAPLPLAVLTILFKERAADAVRQHEPSQRLNRRGRLSRSGWGGWR